MSQFEPISGVSLEQYARLCALMSKTQPEETDKHAQIASDNGVSTESWEAAKDGWTKNMTDPNKAMAIQQVFMPIYQEVCAEMLGGAEPITLEKYAEIKAAMMFGKDAAGNKQNVHVILAKFGYQITEWGTIETYWTSRVAKDEHGRIIDNYTEEYGQKFAALMQEHANKYGG